MGSENPPVLHLHKQKPGNNIKEAKQQFVLYFG